MGIPRRSRPPQAGFTLVELVLTVTLILLLAGAAVLNFGSFQRGAQLDEGLGQLEYLFRLARASAASSGRLVRVSFGGDPQAGATNAPVPAEGILVSWEPDPLQAPGTFRPLSEALPLVERLNGLIQVRPIPWLEPTSELLPSGDMTGTNTLGGLAAGGTVSTNVAAIRFYPDGSSDSADFIVGALDPDDLRKVRVRLSGLVGTVRRQWLPTDPVTGDPLASEPEPNPAAPMESPGGTQTLPRSP